MGKNNLNPSLPSMAGHKKNSAMLFVIEINNNVRFLARLGFVTKMNINCASFLVFKCVTWLWCRVNREGHHNKALPAATIDLWGSDLLICFSVLVLIKPSSASVQIYKAHIKTLVMQSGRHKYPLCSMAITPASAIDCSNRCLAGVACTLVW